MLRVFRVSAIVTAASAFAALTPATNAAVLTFDNATDLTNNFRDLTTPHTLAVSGGVLNVTNNSASARAIVYDTTPVDATVKTTFSASSSPVNVYFDLSGVTAANSSIGIYFIDGSQAESAFASGIILLNVNTSGENDLVRVASYVQPSVAGAGTLATISTGTDLGIGLNGPMTTVKATYTRINANSVNLALTIGSTTVTGNIAGNFWAPTNVEIGLRLFPATAGSSLKLDNIDINPVPEPASLAILGIAGLMVARRKRA